jgi:hypothetical protein
VNLLKNKIGTDQARVLVRILKGHSTLKSLCGNKGDETALDMSGKINGADDAIMLAAEIVDDRVLTQLDVSSNGLGGKTWNSSKGEYDYDLSGIQALADALPKCQ